MSGLGRAFVERNRRFSSPYPPKCPRRPSNLRCRRAIRLLPSRNALSSARFRRRADARDFVERIGADALAVSPDACRSRTGAPHRAVAARSRAPGRAASSIIGRARPGMWKCSRPGIAVGPFGDADQGDVVQSEARPALRAPPTSWPAPPSISTRSGRSGKTSIVRRLRSLSRRQPTAGSRFEPGGLVLEDAEDSVILRCLDAPSSSAPAA